MSGTGAPPSASAPATVRGHPNPLLTSRDRASNARARCPRERAGSDPPDSSSVVLSTYPLEVGQRRWVRAANSLRIGRMPQVWTRVQYSDRTGLIDDDY